MMIALSSIHTIKAFVLLKVELSMDGRIIEELSSIGFVVDAYVIRGVYDLF